MAQMKQYRFSEEILEEDKTIRESETLVSSELPDHARSSAPFGPRKDLRLHRIVNCALTVVLLCSIAVIWLHGAGNNLQCNLNAEHYHYYSPALKATKPGSRVTHLNHTKWSPFSPSGDNPLEYVDGNWTALLRVGMMSLNEEEVRRVGASPDAVRLPPDSGGGYMAYLASHHHLHCLYILHQSLHKDYYQTRSVVWNMSAEMRHSHWDHCIEALRQYVICNADTTVVTHNWFERVNVPIASQDNPRRCADWDAHFRWQLDRQAPAPGAPLTKPADAVERPVLPVQPPSDYLSMYLSG
ncbi:hypothetical protein F5Y05DRAFT_414804 [Hypoxylon sp. FL0543]|nr:hypothetical protein F5Y05DRAFT_414804 [Hypoxylon sp. FL0543]